MQFRSYLDHTRARVDAIQALGTKAVEGKHYELIREADGRWVWRSLDAKLFAAFYRPAETVPKDAKGPAAVDWG